MQALDPRRALVLFSGGQDSSIALGWALERFQSVETIGFDYGQRHAVELGARATVRREITKSFPAWAKKLGPDRLVDLAGLAQLNENAMTHETPIGVADDGLPNTFVPGRNLIFFAMAAALAYGRKTGVLVGGMCEVDFSGYPDCRENTLSSMQETLRFGLDAELSIETPLLSISKAQSWALAEKTGGAEFVEIVRVHSHTCYVGARGELHDWGYGCGACPACKLRATGWEAYEALR